MGNTLNCCVCTKWGWHRGRVWPCEPEICEAATGNTTPVAPVPAAVEPTEFAFEAVESLHVHHIQDREMTEDSALEPNPSDDPRAGTIFLQKAQTDVQEKRKSNHMNHVSTKHFIKKCSSCSTIYLDDSTASQPHLTTVVKSVALAIYYHMKKRDADKSLDIFDEQLHPLTQEKMPKEYFEYVPEHKFIYRFVRVLFKATNLTAEFAIVTLIYIERLLSYAEIDLCPTNWKRIVMGAILFASKVWEDVTIWNGEYCRLFGNTSIEDMNELERQFLQLIDYNVKVSGSVYAKYYFDLRSLAKDNSLHLPVYLLNKERAQNLEAISRMEDAKIFYSATMRRSFRADNFINFQRSKAIIS
ncbi:cyclin-Y-like protein 2 [Hylobates moloch]|uniref:cyclin-Y-like protein 2 n=1 Tax=Hylobates moloch TaxID=81572 RepID=UPI001362E909|nr:cyclin-Y-like protein 2 [Hylobates moloch]